MIKGMVLIAVVVIGLLLIPELNFEANARQLQSHVTNETLLKHPSAIAKQTTSGSYISGTGFSIGSIIKFKQHKDNPTQGR